MNALPAREVQVDVAEATLVCAWPRNAGHALLRGAVCGEMMRALSAAGLPELHADWHNHAGAAGTIQQAPRVMYRITDQLPRVFFWGPRAHGHALACARHLRSLRFDSEDRVIPIDEVQVATRTERAGCTGRRPHVYRLASPMFPPKVSAERRPKNVRTPEARAWASFLVAASVRALLGEMGVDLDGGRPVDLHMEDLEWGEVRYRGTKEAGVGFVATIYTTADLPDGVGIGARRSEGFGELRRVARPEWR